MSLPILQMLRTVLLTIALLAWMMKPTSAIAGDQAPQPHIELVAISVSDIDASIAWYSELFDLDVTERNAYPNGTAVAFLTGQAMRLELVELADAIAFDAPVPDNPASRHGIVKLAFASADIKAVNQRVTENDVRVLFPLHLSDRDGRCYLTLTDPDGNWIQFVGECAK